MASPLILISAVRAALRLYQAGDRAIQQRYRDRDRVFPKVKAKFFDSQLSARTISLERRRDDDFSAWITDNGLDDTFKDMENGDRAAHLTIQQAVEAYSRQGDPENRHIPQLERAEYEKLKQWQDDETKPVAPATRFALVLLDVAAEFISFNPGLLARGGNGERLIGSLAGQISHMIPDDEQFGGQHRLASRLAGMVFRAGLETITENKNIIATQEHQSELVDALTKPIIAAFPDDVTLAQELKWENILDAFAGPALTATFGVLANHQEAFLGAKFGSEELLGKLNQTLLTTLQDRGLKETLSQDGIIALYRGALGVVVENPGMFVSGDSDRDQFVKSLLTGFAETLRNEDLIASGDRNDYGIQLSLAALNAFGAHSDQFLKPGGKPLEQIASNALNDILGALKSGLADGKRPDEVFGKDLAYDLVTNILGEVSKHPEIFDGKEALEAVFQGLTESLGSGKRLDEIFGKEAVVTLVGNVLKAAAGHPDLLKGKDELKIVLAALQSGLAGEKRLDEVFGEEMAIAIVTNILTAAADHPDLLKEKDELKILLDALRKGLAGEKRLDEVFGKETALALVQDILLDVAGRRNVFGSKEQLGLIVETLGSALAGGKIGEDFVPDLMKSVLADISANPDLAKNQPELTGILTALGAAISADKGALISPEDWRHIIASTLRQATENPGRLFGLDPVDPASELAVVAIKTLLDAAVDGVNGDRTKGGVLFGSTLTRAIEATLSAIASNPSRAARILLPDEAGNEISRVAFYIDQISTAVRVRPDGVHFIMGSKEWLRLYRAVFMRLLNEDDRLSQVRLAFVAVDGKTLTSEGEQIIEDILTTFVPIGN